MKLKKLIVLFTTVCMLGGLVACGGNDDTNVNTNDDQTVTEDNNGSDTTEEKNNSGSYDEITEEVVRNHAVTGASDFEYEKYDGTDEIKITSYTGKDAIVVFPEEIDGCPVTKISNYFFANDEYPYVRGVLIPKSIKEINATFANNSSVEVVVLEGTEILGERAFLGCSNLKTIILPNTLKTIEDYGLASWTNIKEIVIPESVENISEDAFGLAYDVVFKGKEGSYIQTYYEGSYLHAWESDYRCKFEVIE